MLVYNIIWLTKNYQKLPTISIVKFVTLERHENLTGINTFLRKNIILTKEENTINIKIRYQEQLTSQPSFSNYIISSLACAITKTANRPLIIKDVLKNNNIDEITMELL